MAQISHLYMTTGKTIALTIWTFVGKVTSLLFNMLSRFAIAFLPFNITVIQDYAPTTKAEKAEVERFYDDLQDLLELTPKKVSFSS